MLGLPVAARRRRRLNRSLALERLESRGEKMPTDIALQPASFIRRISSSHISGLRIHWSGL